MVSVTITGRMECRKVRIDPSVLSDPEMAEDLIAAAFNDAVNKVERRVAGEDGRRDRRHAVAAGHEAAVLIAAAELRSERRSSPTDPSTCPPSRGGAKER